MVATFFEREVDARVKLSLFYYARALEISAELESKKTKTKVECVYPKKDELMPTVLEFMSSARAKALESVSEELDRISSNVPDGGVLVLLDGEDSYVSRKGREWPSVTRVGDLVDTDPDRYAKSREYRRILALVRHGLARGERDAVMEYVGVRFPNTRVAMLVRETRRDRKEPPAVLATEHCTLLAV